MVRAGPSVCAFYNGDRTVGIQHVIWDWNGTIVDDTALCLDIINGQLRHYNKPPVSLERYRELFDFPLQGLYKRLGFDFSTEPYQGVNGAFLVEYNRRRMECPLRDGVVEVLDELAVRDIGCSVLSAYATDLLQEAVRHYGLSDRFKAIVGLDNTLATGKTDEGKRLVDRLGFAPSQLMLVGDTTHDFAVAREIGATCVLVSGGYQSRAKLETCGIPVLDSCRGLPALLRGRGQSNPL